jgi:hypothetical protein
MAESDRPWAPFFMGLRPASKYPAEKVRGNAAKYTAYKTEPNE